MLARLATAALLAGALLASSGVARADELVLRGNYWRDQNTRVIQPEADVNKSLPSRTIIGAHYLLDAITSASAAAGVTSDQPFTELRNEIGVNIAQQLGPAAIGASYSYSSESDYWAHLASVNGSVDLFQHNTTLALSAAFGSDTVGQRMAPTSYSILGGLQKVYLLGGWTQVLAPTLLATLNMDVGLIGFGTQQNGFQANPYRTVIVGGSPNREKVPYARTRLAWALTLYWTIPLPSKLISYLSFRPGYRFYYDDWGIVSSTPELRTYLPIGPVELRLTGRYYTQTAASFWRGSIGPRPTPNDPNPIQEYGNPIYVNTPSDPLGSTGATCPTCLRAPNDQRFYSADPKLSPYDDMYLELAVQLKLGFLRPVSKWLSNGLMMISYGHLFTSGYQHTWIGDAELAGMQFNLPL